MKSHKEAFKITFALLYFVCFFIFYIVEFILMILSGFGITSITTYKITRPYVRMPYREIEIFDPERKERLSGKCGLNSSRKKVKHKVESSAKKSSSKYKGRRRGKFKFSRRFRGNKSLRKGISGLIFGILAFLVTAIKKIFGSMQRFTFKRKNKKTYDDYEFDKYDVFDDAIDYDDCYPYDIEDFDNKKLKKNKKTKNKNNEDGKKVRKSSEKTKDENKNSESVKKTNVLKKTNSK